MRWGRLFLERFNRAEARQLFKEALEIGPTMAGRISVWRWQRLKVSSVRRSRRRETAIKFDPSLLEAQELLARLALEDSNPEKAAEEADAALKMSPEALDAMAVHASIELLANKPATRLVRKMRR